MAAIEINIGDENFNTKKAATERCRELLNGGAIDDLITNSRDQKLLETLFYSRREKLDELNGRKIIGWGREQNPSTRCFAALLDDGSKLHFSFPKSIDALIKRASE